MEGTMTVKELRERLEQYGDHLPIVLNGNWRYLHKVYLYAEDYGDDSDDFVMLEGEV
jgi:hypothetical protein